MKNTIIRKIRIWAVAAALLAASASCVRELEDDIRRINPDGTVRVRLSCDIPTKSALFDEENENRITSLTVFVYSTKGGDFTNNPYKDLEYHYSGRFPEVAFRRQPEWNQSGRLVTEKTFLSTHNMTLDLPVTKNGEKLHIYAVANMPDLHATADESSFASMTFRYPSVSAMGTAIPMVAEQVYDFIGEKESEYGFHYLVKLKDYKPFAAITVTPDGTRNVSLTMNKAVARYRFRMNNTLAGYLEPVSIRLRQSPLVIRPFARGYKAESASDVGDGDTGTEEDVSLCEGQAVNFYCLENMQGEIEPTRPGGGMLLDPTEWDKVPERIHGKGDVCTYIELVGFMNGGLDGMMGNVTYRFYLGKDNIRNYDIERNTSYDVSLTVTEGGLAMTSWRITDDRTEFALGTDIYMAQKFTYEVEPADGTVLSLSPGSNITNNGNISIRPMTNASAQVVGCEVSAIAPGTSAVYARNGGTVKKIFEINVRAPILTADRDSVDLLLEGKAEKLDFHYETWDGFEMSKEQFDKTLYDSLLDYSVTTAATRLSVEKNSITGKWEAYVNSFGGTTEASQLSGTAIARAASPAIYLAYVTLNVLDLIDINADLKFQNRRVEFWSKDMDGTQWSPLGVHVNAHAVEADVYYGESIAGPKIDFYRVECLNSNGWLFVENDYRHCGTGGVFTVKMSVTNFRSGERWNKGYTTFRFTSIINFKVCGKVKMITSYGKPYAEISAWTENEYLFPTSVLVARKNGRTREYGHIGSVIYRDELDAPMTVERYKELHPYGPDFLIVKYIDDDEIPFSEWPRCELPVFFDDDKYMYDHGYYKYHQGGWVD